MYAQTDLQSFPEQSSVKQWTFPRHLQHFCLWLLLLQVRNTVQRVCNGAPSYSHVSLVVESVFFPSACVGCSARSHFSKEIGNCQSFGVVYLSSRNFTSTGTVCGTVDKITADYICSSLEQGAAVDFGTAENKG